MGADERELGLRQPPGGRADGHDRPGGVRLEYRRPGADLNPYLSIASCIDSGLYGIANAIEPPEPSVGPAFADESIPSLPD